MTSAPDVTTSIQTIPPVEEHDRGPQSEDPADSWSRNKDCHHENGFQRKDDRSECVQGSKSIETSSLENFKLKIIQNSEDFETCKSNFRTVQANSQFNSLPSPSQSCSLCLENNLSFQPVNFNQGMPKSSLQHSTSSLNQTENHVAYSNSLVPSLREKVYSTNSPCFFSPIHAQRDPVYLTTNMSKSSANTPRRSLRLGTHFLSNDSPLRGNQRLLQDPRNINLCGSYSCEALPTFDSQLQFGQCSECNPLRPNMDYFDGRSDLKERDHVLRNRQQICNP